MPQSPILIVAQSGRFLAQTAKLAGYPVWVADCFGDDDTISYCSRWHTLPPFNELTVSGLLAIINNLSRGENCQLIFGSGIEYIFPILGCLPTNTTLVGNSLETFHKIKTPQLFFKLLSQLVIDYPETQFSLPEDKQGWLRKSASGLGGSHIQFLEKDKTKNNHYFQKYIKGQSGSCLFLADGKQVQILSIQQQWLSTSTKLPFQLAGLENPMELSRVHHRQLISAIKQLVPACQLKGLNSIDFIISEQQQLLITEINPRPSASVELQPNKVALLQQHIDACQGTLPNDASSTLNDAAISLRYHFAKETLSIPETMNWPTESHDHPPATSIVNKGGILCSSLIHASGNHRSHRDIEKEIDQQLIT